MKVMRLSSLRHTGILSVHPTRVVKDLDTGEIETYIPWVEDDIRLTMRSLADQVGRELDEKFLSQKTRQQLQRSEQTIQGWWP